ncbi:MAG: hypothetical protein DCC68_21270 [Planctomycetota bacterium]|nr:MAG: hypothetical protein DCC68_21270 [Planctomycetota bacterium]
MPETESLPIVDEAVAEFLCRNPNGAFTLPELAESVGYPLPAVGDACDRLADLGVTISGTIAGVEKFTLSQRWTDRVRAATAKPATPDADAQDDEPEADGDEIEVEAEHAGGQKIRTYVYDGPQAIQACKRQAVAAGEDLSNRTYLYRDERGDWTEAD